MQLLKYIFNIYTHTYICIHINIEKCEIYIKRINYTNYCILQTVLKYFNKNHYSISFKY